MRPAGRRRRSCARGIPPDPAAGSAYPGYRGSPTGHLSPANSRPKVGGKITSQREHSRLRILQEYTVLLKEKLGFMILSLKSTVLATRIIYKKKIDHSWPTIPVRVPFLQPDFFSSGFCKEVPDPTGSAFANLV